jgi:hypothetical protein
MTEVTIETDDDDSVDIEFLAPSPNDIYVQGRREINVPCARDKNGIWHYGEGVSAGKIHSTRVIETVARISWCIEGKLGERAGRS